MFRCPPRCDQPVVHLGDSCKNAVRQGISDRLRPAIPVWVAARCLVARFGSWFLGYAAGGSRTEGAESVIVLGVILILVGYLLPVPGIIATIGWILLVIGLVLLVLGRMGRPVGGRRYWY
jgi:Family of unknown function (DUF6131)